MTDEARTTGPDDTDKPRQPATSRWRRRWLLWAGIPSLALAGAMVGRAFAHGGHGRCGFHHHGRAQTPEELEERMQVMANRVLAHLDTSEQQEADVRAVLNRRAPALHALHQEGRELRHVLLAAAQQDDRTELESVRKQGIAVIDRGTALWIETIQELSDVLTEEQRAKVFAHLNRFRGRD